jgi:elongation factor 4
VVTKIDLPTAQPEDAALAMATTFQVDPTDVIMTSSKTRVGILEVMRAVVDRLPSPVVSMREAVQYGKDALDPELSQRYSSRFHGRIVDSWFDEHRGVVCLVQAVAGSLREGDKISTYASVQESKDIDSKTEFSVQDIGLLTPSALRTGRMRTGQVGYVIAGLRSTRQARIGDTMYVPTEWGGHCTREARESIIPLQGYAPAKPMLYASVFPVDTLELEALFAAVDKLVLNDSSISVTRDQSSSLGAGLRCGFLGFLHMEVFNQRLNDEFGIKIVMTTPSVPYTIEARNLSKNIVRGQPEVVRKEISSVADWPVAARDISHRIFEPVVKVTLITPQLYYGAMVELLKVRRGDNIEVNYLDDGSVLVTALVPWQEVVCDMNDAVKNGSAGYASFNYVEADSIQSELVKVEIAVNGEPCDPLSFICHSSVAASEGRRMAAKLKDVISRQNFEIILQARIGMKVLARERIAPYRKDVLVKGGKTVGGGDITRKKKLLEKQKEGKKRAKMVGKVEIDQSAFWAVLQR